MFKIDISGISVGDHWYWTVNEVSFHGQTLIITWFVILVIVAFSITANTNLEPTPTKYAQNFSEYLTEFIREIAETQIGHSPQSAFWTPFIAMIFTFIFVANWSGSLIPLGLIRIPDSELAAPTNDINTTVALSLLTSFSYFSAGLSKKGIAYFSRYTSPAFFLLPINVLEDFTKPLSLSFRLFGNVLADELVVGVVVSLVPLLIPIPLILLGLFTSAIQALVFSTLAGAYIGEALELLFIIEKMKRKIVSLLVLSYFTFYNNGRERYPIFAQQNYTNPREANGRIVCANCHLAQKPVELKIPQSVLPNTVFDRVVNIPYEPNSKQVTRNGKLGEINVGAVLILPKDFQIATLDRSPTPRTPVSYFQPYSGDLKNVIVVGPVPGKANRDLVFPVITPTNDAKYLKYPVYLGGNRGRGQVYPDGSKSNNNIFFSPLRGKVTRIEKKPGKEGVEVVFETIDGKEVKEKVPLGPDIIIKVGESVRVDQPITSNPNVGGFGQAESEIVLQDPLRIQFLLLFFFAVTATQVSLVLKKKQFEKIQLAIINFLCFLFLLIWDSCFSYSPFPLLFILFF